MSRESEEFGSLRRLLVLKRHEQPPPGYFNHFSAQVIARIKAGERVDEGVLDRLFWEAPWLQRLWAALEAKPILAGAFGAVVCGLLIFGVIYSEKLEVKPVDTVVELETPATDTIQIANVSPSEELLLTQPATTALSDKTGMAQPVAVVKSQGTLFDLVPKPQAEAASLGLTLK